MATSRAMSRRLAGFRLLGIGVALFVLVNLTVFILISFRPELLEVLWLSADRPWGIITSIFAHADASHLFWNLLFFLIFCLFFTGVGWRDSPKVRRDSTKIFLAVALAAGIIANAEEFLALWYPSGITHLGSWGASGVVYASGGALLVFSIHKLPSVVEYIQKIRRSREKIDHREFFMAMLPAFIIIWMFMDILSGFGRGLAGITHGLGFLLGFLMATALWDFGIGEQKSRRKR
ncbi:MAG: rhomboid family intramembrane serine protease [Candidatus Hadarchaeales archaeon]